MRYLARLNWDRADAVWLVRIEDLHGAHTYGRSLSAAIVNAQEAVEAAIDDVGFDLDVEIDPAGLEPERLEQLQTVLAARELRHQAQRIDGEVIATVRRATTWSARELSVLVGLSPARISQITTSATTAQQGQGTPAGVVRVGRIQLIDGPPSEPQRV